MILFGEKLNSSIAATRRAFTRHDEDTVRKLCTAQQAGGAAYLDINTAMLGEDEWETMRWVMDIALESTDCGIMVDTPNTEVGRKALDYLQKKGRPVIFNSVTLDARVELVDTISDLGYGVVALPMLQAMPADTEERLDNAITLAQLLVDCRIPPQNIYMDILLTPLAADSNAAKTAIDALRRIHQVLPGLHLTCGLSNLSHGLPKPKAIQQAFLYQAMPRGLDSAILDTTEPTLALAAEAMNAVLGKDELCLTYVKRAK